MVFPFHVWHYSRCLTTRTHIKAIQICYDTKKFSLTRLVMVRYSISNKRSFSLVSALPFMFEYEINFIINRYYFIRYISYLHEVTYRFHKHLKTKSIDELAINLSFASWQFKFFRYFISFINKWFANWPIRFVSNFTYTNSITKIEVEIFLINSINSSIILWNKNITIIF